MGSHSATCQLTQVNTSHLNPSQKPVLDLPSPEGWKAELSYVTGYIPNNNRINVLCLVLK